MNKPSSIEFGARIAARRNQLHLTQAQASEKAGLSHQFFACVERGSKNMRMETIIRTAQALEVSTDYLLFGTWNEYDDRRISMLLEPLNQRQKECFEVIARNYVIACGCGQKKD